MAEYIFWISVVIIAYTYAGYPFILFIASLIIPKKVKQGDITPFVSLVMAVYNEESLIERKIENLNSLDYPQEKIEILIGSDGSTDGTNAFISKNVSEFLRFFPRMVQRGKVSLLNEIIPQARGEIIVFTDARQAIPLDSIKKIVRNFADPTVGAVSGELILRGGSPGSISEGIGWYWKYEKWLRTLESKIGSMLGATGAFYAIRKKLYIPPAEDILLDDMIIPLQIIRQGYRAVFDNAVIVYDDVSSTMKKESARKVRTLAGNWQLLFRFPSFFNPFSGGIGFQLISHKLLRLLVPFMMFTAAVSNIFLFHLKCYTIIAVIQLTWYVLAVCGFACAHSRIRFILIPYTFCSLNYAAVKGLVSFVFGLQKTAWKK